MNQESIAGERRSDCRYGLRLELRWKLVRRKRVLDSGNGYTINLSSGGILFEAGRQMPAGVNVELSIIWPVLLHNVAPLQLLAYGRIVRAERGRAAIRMTQHVFKTIGISSAHRAVLAATSRDPVVMTAGMHTMSGFGKVQ